MLDLIYRFIDSIKYTWFSRFLTTFTCVQFFLLVFVEFYYFILVLLFSFLLLKNPYFLIVVIIIIICTLLLLKCFRDHEFYNCIYSGNNLFSRNKIYTHSVIRFEYVIHFCEIDGSGYTNTHHNNEYLLKFRKKITVLHSFYT